MNVNLQLMGWIDAGEHLVENLTEIWDRVGTQESVGLTLAITHHNIREVSKCRGRLVGLF